MSDTTDQPPLTSAELVASRRYCGYPAYGSGQTGFQSWRFFQAYGTLEYRLANLSSDEITVVRTTYLANLPGLETGVIGAAANLDTDSASVWKHNPAEIRDRTALYRQWRFEFAAFLGVPPGPGLDQTSFITV